MSTQINKALAQLCVKDQNGPWGQLLTQNVRRTRRSASVRLQSASRALASLRMSERNEREMLHRATVELRRAEADRATDVHHAALLMLDIDLHRSNLVTIEQQVALVRLAIEHLNRRTNGWSAKSATNEPSRQHKDDRADAPNEKMVRGFEVVREIRRLRNRKFATEASGG